MLAAIEIHDSTPDDDAGRRMVPGPGGGRGADRGASGGLRDCRSSGSRHRRGMHTEKLDAILEAATREPGPSPVAEALAAILSSLREQESLLLDLPRVLTEAMRGERRPGAEEGDAEESEINPAGSLRYPDQPGEGS